jgi:hypothetical protein
MGEIRFHIIDTNRCNGLLQRMPLKNLTKKDILAGLGRLSELAQKENVILEMSIYGGALMLLAYDARPTTKDVDAIILPPEIGRQLVMRVAEEKDWSEDWVNDDVKQFVSMTETRHSWAPAGLNAPALRISRPTAKYLLAMKVMACRKALPGHPGDEVDIAFLLRKMEIKSFSEIEQIVDRYFPDTVLPPATQAVVERLLLDLR